MQTITTIGFDIAKSVFQVHGVDAGGQVVIRRQLKRRCVLAFFQKLPPCLVGIEACASSHHWSRELQALGHTVRLMPPAYVKPYVKRQKNDMADAEAICEAVARANMRFVPTKTPEQQSCLMLHRTRHLFIRQQTALINSIRAHLAEFGIVAPVGRKGVTEGYPPNMLIDDFSTFYQGRIAVFKHATHVLDMEESIQDRFLQTPLTSGGKPVTHYRFADSKAEPGIQLADIVVGVLGKMHSYFTETPPDEVAADRANLTGTGLQNAELLRDLIAASHDATMAFLHHVSSMHDLDKLALFLRFQDGAYAGR
jgi:hypothetical protein